MSVSDWANALCRSRTSNPSTSIVVVMKTRFMRPLLLSRGGYYRCTHGLCEPPVDLLLVSRISWQAITRFEIPRRNVLEMCVAALTAELRSCVQSSSHAYNGG